MTKSKSKTKHLNLRAVVILAALVPLLSLLIFFVHAAQVQRNAANLREQADLFKQTGQHDLALKALDQYLGLVPEDIDSLAKLGFWLDESAKNLKDKGRAFLVLEQVLRREESRLDVQRKTAQLAVELGLFAEAKKHLQYLRDHHVNDAEVLKLLAQAEAGAKQYAQADKFYAEALASKGATDQLRVELFAAYAYLLRNELDSPKKADVQIATLVQEQKKSPTARLAAAKYYRAFALWDKADQQIQFALKELNVKDAVAFLLAGEIAQARGNLAQVQKKPEEAKVNFQAARALFEKGLKLYPHDIELILATAVLDIQEGNKAAAAAHLQTALAQLPNRIDHLFSLGNLLIDADRSDQTKGVIDRLANFQVTPFADFLRARLAVHREEWGEAAILLEQARTHPLLDLEVSRLVQLGPRLELLLGDCYGMLGNPDQQIASYERALHKTPKWAPAQQRLATTLAAVGKFGEAIKQHEQMNAPTLEQDLELVGLWINFNRTVPLPQRQWHQAENLLAQLEKSNEKSGQLLLLRANMLAAQGKLDQAQKLAEAVRDQVPHEVAPWLLLIALAQGQKDQDQKVLDYLDEAEKKTGLKAEWHLTRAGYWTRKDPTQAKHYLKELEKDLVKFSGIDRDRLLLGLGESYLNINAVAEANKLWTQLAQRQPTSVQVRYRLMDLAYHAKKLGEMEDWLEEIRKLEGGVGPHTAYGEAARFVLLAEGKDHALLAKAHAKLDLAAGLRPSWSRVPWLRGVLYDLEFQKEKALESYQKALALGDRRLGVYKRALELMQDLGMIPEANGLLQELPQAVKSSEDFYRLFVEVAVLNPAQIENHLQAVQVAEQAVANSTDYQDFLWLGQVAALAKFPVKAEIAFGQARAKAEKGFQQGKLKKDDVTLTWVVLLVHLANTDRAKAEAEIKVAESKLSADQLPIVLAPCCEFLGDLKKAEQQYQKALTDTPNDPVLLRNVASFYGRHGPVAKAEPLLRKLLLPATNAPEPTRKWARRSLALVLSKVTGDYVKFQEALALIELNRENGQLSLVDLQARALVLSEHPGHALEAIEELQKLSVGTGKLPDNLQFRLAQLYFDNRQWDKSDTQLNLLLKTADKNPAYMALHVRSLLLQGKIFGAAQQVQKLAEVRPQAFETVELQARILHAGKKGNQAKDLLAKFTKEKKDAPLTSVARLLEELDAVAEAEEVYRHHITVTDSPLAMLELARFLGRHGRVDEALAACAEADKKSSPPAALGLTLAEVSLQSKATDAQRNKVIGWLKKMVKDHAKVELLWIVLADLHGYQGQTDEAIEIYETVLAKNQNNVPSLNNLAYLLAFQNGRLPEAKQKIEAALHLAGPMGGLLDTRAVIWLQGKQPKNAIEDLQAALSQKETPTRYFHMAQAHFMEGNLLKSEQIFTKCVQEFSFATNLLPAVEQAEFKQMAIRFKVKVK